MISQRPAKVGKYDIIEMLGKGAMGVVYKAHDPYMDRAVAIKLAVNERTDEQSESITKRMFINEARSAGRLDHPNILKVYEAGEEQGVPYMVMELIAGGNTLRNYCQPHTRLPIKQVVMLIRQAAKALEYAHTQSVLHRDIKPSNIMLTEAGVTKLVDFGIAHRIGADQTQPLIWGGTPLYMSPEQAQYKEVTAQSDLFSLGSVFYEMLAGAPAFGAKDSTLAISRIIRDNPEPLPALREDLPEILWDIVRKMLSKDLARRYRTGAQIVRDLDIALEDLAHSPKMLTEEQRIAKMKGLAFFASFSRAELKEVAKVAAWLNYPAGEIFFNEGDEECALFVLAEGSVALSIDGVRILDLDIGECFGEMEYLSDTKRTLSATATRDCTVLKIERDFRNWASLPSQMRLSRAFQDVLVQRLGATSKTLAKALGGEGAANRRNAPGGNFLRQWRRS